LENGLFHGLVKTYCLPSVLYGCETWNLDHGDYHRLNVLTGTIRFAKLLGAADVKVLLTYVIYVLVPDSTYVIHN